MKSKIAMAVATILLASGTAYAMQGGMACCQNCSCCNEKHKDGHAAPAPAPTPAPTPPR